MTKQLVWIVRSSRAALVLLFVTWAPAGVAQVMATLTAGVHLRAGPDIFFPSVMILPPGAAVQVFGCEQGFNWCDVQGIFHANPVRKVRMFRPNNQIVQYLNADEYQRLLTAAEKIRWYL